MYWIIRNTTGGILTLLDAELEHKLRRQVHVKLF